MSFRLLSILLCCVHTLAWPDVVHSDDGPVQGSKNLLSGLRVFHGIPFAAPPTGALRWKPPQRPTPWTKPKQAVKPGHQCTQLDLVKGVLLGSEDCLYLSVYVPKQCTPATPCATMQWIYGGGWELGSNREFSLYDASSFAKKNGVVVVAGNYRLDTFGWLALAELQQESADGSYGNYGLKDQRAAMQWTQRNIGLFGGHPNKVTIFGESAGAWSVCQHLVAPASNGLFSAGIMESGDCEGPWMVLDANAKRFGSAYVTATGCAANSTDRLECMRGLTTEKAMVPYIDWFCYLNSSTNPYCKKQGVSNSDPAAWPHVLYTAEEAAQSQTGTVWPTPLPPMAPIISFAAVVDGVELPDSPLRLIQQKKINKSPTGHPVCVILGTNHDEFAAFVASLPLVIPKAKLPFKESDMELVAQHLVGYHDHWNQTTVAQVIAAYKPTDYKTESERIVTAGTDFCFRCGTRNAARALADAGIETYLYSFEFRAGLYRDPASLGCELTNEVLCGDYHGNEVGYVFGNGLISAAGHKISDQIGKYWSNMAKHGSPNSENMQVQWPLYNKIDDQHLVLGNTITGDSGLAKKNCDFWDTLPRMDAPN